MMATAIIPMLNEEENVEPAYRRLREILDECSCSWELICVDDGSTDATFEDILKLAASDPRVRALRMSRNFGVHAALTAALRVARGDCAFMVGADLQEPVRQLPQFIEKWQEGYDVVWGVRLSRQDPPLTRLLSNLFHTLLAWAGALPAFPRHAAFVFMDRKVADAIAKLPERNRMVWGMIAWLGFRQTQIACPFGVRERGGSRWTFGKRVKLAIDTFTSFSYVPIRLVSFLGISISLLSFLYGIGIVLGALFGGVAVQGWPTLMAIVLFLGGLQLLVSGMMGEYLWRALDEARGRPLYFVSQAVGLSESEAASIGVVTGSGRDTASRDATIWTR